MSSERELENFCRNVAWLRKHSGLSKREMARLLGIGVGSLNQIEQGILPPRLGVEVFFRLKKAFGIPLAGVLKGRLEEGEK